MAKLTNSKPGIHAHFMDNIDNIFCTSFPYFVLMPTVLNFLFCSVGLYKDGTNLIISIFIIPRFLVEDPIASKHFYQ